MRQQRDDASEVENALQRQQAMLALLQEITLAVNEADTIEAVFAPVLAKIARFMDWPLAHVCVWAEEKAALISSRIWHCLEESAFSLFRELTEQTKYVPDQGAVGKVLADGRPLTILDIAQSPHFLRHSTLTDLGIRAYFAFPVLVGGMVTAVLEFFSPQTAEPDEAVKAIISHINIQLGVALRRIQTEKALRESERRFRAIFNQTFQFIGLMQPDGTLIEANETALQLAGLAAADVIGKPFWETYWWTISPETQAQLKQAIACAAAGEFVRYEVDILGRDNHIAAIDFSIKPIKNRDDQVVLLIPEGRDISQQKEAIARLQRSQLQLAEAQRLAHIGHWEWDIRADKITWSDELYRIFGVQPGEFVASYEAFLELIHPDDRAYAKGKIAAAYENGRSFSYFHRIIRPDGAIRTVHARGRPTQDSHGNIIKLYGTAQDMTEQRATELKLSQTIRQLSALNEMGQIIASSLDMPVIYERVLSAIRPLIRAEAVILFLHEDDELVVTALDHTGIGDMLGQRIPTNFGIAGSVWQSSQSLHLSGEDCLRQLSPTLMESTGYKPLSMLAVPIRWQERNFGVLEAAHSQPGAFEGEDLSLLETAATWTALAISNAQQYEQLQRRLHESQAIARISQALAAEALDLDQILQLIVNLARQIVPNVDWAAIHLLRGDPERLYLAANSGLEWELDEYILNPGEGVAGRVITTGRVTNVTDLQDDPRRLPIHKSLNVRSLLVAPVQGRMRRIGTISLQCAIPNSFTPEDEQLLTILGVQAGMVIENARLLENQRRARQVAEHRRERMRRLGRQVITAQEEERQRISRELHDEAGQSLTSIKISLDLIRATLPDDLGSVKQNLAEVIELTDQTMSNLRMLAHNLRPPGLDAFGLNAALVGLCQDFAMHTQLQVEYKDTDIPDLPQLTALSLYRFAQEALTNVVKHAEAKRVEVILQADAEQVRLSVKDDGRGFDLSAEMETTTKTAGIGLTGMYERLETMGGSLEIQSAPGQGTTLIACVPLAEETLTA